MNQNDILPQGILVINCGSSSIKFSLIDLSKNMQIIGGLAECLHTDKARIHWKSNLGNGSEAINDFSHRGALIIINKILQPFLVDINLQGIGHRVVHGGENLIKPTIIDSNIIRVLKECCNLAPLHNPANILGIESSMEIFPKIPQVAVFDTGFHHTIPDYIYHYALPYEWYEKYKLRRYGFHGISHCYVVQRCAIMLNKPLEKLALISAHLGNGCSACAVLNGNSIDTTMGFTPLEGLVMGSRCGDIDPSIVDYISKKEQLTVAEITKIFNNKSGLLGVSGLSNDMRELLAASNNGNINASLAINIFCYRLAKHLAGLIVPLGRVDALIFTGGIGENAAIIRFKVMQYLKFFNFTLDEQANTNHGKDTNGRITTVDSPLALVIHTNEEEMIAKETMAAIYNNKS